MATIHLVEGPVGAGKSTFAAQLALTHLAPRLILDEWMVTLFKPDRPNADFMQWYSDRKNRCIEQIWRVACDLIDTGTNVVLELGLVQLSDREEFYCRVDATDCELKIYVLDAPKGVRRQRVRNRNSEKGSTFQMEVPDEIFELANTAWQAPDDAECRDRDIQIIATNC
jgi:predicted kinase